MPIPAEHKAAGNEAADINATKASLLKTEPLQTERTQNQLPQIKLTNINKTYQVGEQALQVLNELSFSCQQGEYISIMGPSGSGKSTLLNMIGLLDRPDNGSYLMEKQQTERLSEEQRAKLRREKIGFVFQNFHLIPRLTAFENAELPLMLAGIAPTERRLLSENIFKQLSIADRGQHLPKQLSGGQLQRVAIARAMMMSPTILLADEPTGNLDQKSGAEVIDVLEKLNQSGISLLIVTHDKAIGARADRQLTMVDGKITDDHSKELSNALSR
jgi:putative ABC transport system ATP-binding protein